MVIERWNPEQDGSLSEEALRRKLEVLGYTAERYIYAPGTYFPLHAHDVDKIDAVISGHFRITMGDEEHLLGAGDVLFIPQGVEHSAEVVGDESVANLDAVRVR